MRILKWDRVAVTTCDILEVPEDLLMDLQEGAEKQIKMYKESLQDPKMSGEEDQAFLRGQIRQLEEFVRISKKLV